MFRENVLCNDAMVERISTTMVPIAMDLQVLKDPGARETQALQPWIPSGKGGVRSVTGVWILSPHGTVLARPLAGFEDMFSRTVAQVEDALKAFGPVAPRTARAVESHPYNGRGVMPDGRVRLAETVREVDAARASIPSPVVSGVTLTPQEFAAFAPPQPVAGAEWDVPASVAKKLCRVTSPMCYQHAPRPDSVTGVVLHARVRAVADGVAWLSYEGRIATRYPIGDFEKISIGRVPGDGLISEQEMTLAGEGVYDLGTGELRSVRLVGSGTLLQKWKSTEPLAIRGLIEWEREAPEAPASGGAR